MSETEIRRKRGNGKWTLLANLGLVGTVLASVVTWFLSTSSKQQEQLGEIKQQLKVLETKTETDGAQWNVIRRFHTDLADVKAKANANQRIIDRALLGAPPVQKLEKKQEQLKRLPIRRKKAPPTETTREYRKHMEQRWLLEQRTVPNRPAPSKGK